jgi:hypothetical protein
LFVHSYPHAISLKSIRRQPVEIPQHTLRTGGRLHVSAVPYLPEPGSENRRLNAFIFLRRRPGGIAPADRISEAEAAARLMENGLNLAAHSNHGVDAAMALAHAVPSYTLDITDLDAASAEIERILTSAPQSSIDQPAIAAGV